MFREISCVYCTVFWLLRFHQLQWMQTKQAAPAFDAVQVLRQQTTEVWEKTLILDGTNWEKLRE